MNGKVMALAAAGLMMFAGGAMAQGSAAKVGTFASENITQERLSAGLSAFFGDNTANYLPAYGQSLEDQFAHTLFIGEGRVRSMPDGDILASSGKLADDKGIAALLLGPDSQVKAAALVHFRCSTGTEASAGPCAGGERPVVTIFVKNYSTVDQVARKFVIEKLRDWAVHWTHTSANNHMVVQVREVGASQS